MARKTVFAVAHGPRKQNLRSVTCLFLAFKLILNCLVACTSLLLSVLACPCMAGDGQGHVVSQPQRNVVCYLYLFRALVLRRKTRATYFGQTRTGLLTILSDSRFIVDNPVRIFPKHVCSLSPPSQDQGSFTRTRSELSDLNLTSLQCPAEAA